MSSRTNEPATAPWDRNRGIIRTRKGAWRPGQVIYSHGYDLLRQLVGHVTFFQNLVLNVTGRLPEKRLGDWLEATFMCMSWPDARIWCNQIGALGGSVRASPVASIAAGVMAADSRMYGPGTVRSSTRFIQRALELSRAGWTTERIVAETAVRGRRVVAVGYSRPLAPADERIEAMQRVATGLGFETGPHLALAYDIEAVLWERHHESINLAGYIMAFLSDQGFSVEEIYRLYATCVNGGIHACYAEAADNPAETFLPMRCDDVEYTGPAERGVPAAGSRP